MKLTDLLKDLELGKLYTDKDRKPFKVNEKQITESTDAYGKSLEKIANDKKLKMISKKDRDTLKRLADLMKEEKLDELGGFSTPGTQGLTSNDYTAPKRDTKGGDMKAFLQKYSSKEAKTIIDGELKSWASQLRKFEGKVVKDWMSAAKSGQIDFFDIIRGLKTGDVSRAHPYETQFLVSLLTKDKIVDRFRSYFKGKKGKSRK